MFSEGIKSFRCWSIVYWLFVEKIKEEEGGTMQYKNPIESLAKYAFSRDIFSLLKYIEYKIMGSLIYSILSIQYFDYF